MAQDGHAAHREEIDRLRHLLPALELDRRAAGLRHDARGGAEGLGRRLLVGAEGEVHDDAGPPGGADHRAAVGDHHVDRDADRRVHAVEHHAERIAHQDEVAGLIDNAGDGRRVGGEAHHRLAPLGAGDIADGEPPDWTVVGHVIASLARPCGRLAAAPGALSCAAT